MSRLTELFRKKNQRVLNIYCTAGYPEFDSTIEIIRALQDHGADILELGIPYSDPLADGPVIQESSNVALANGMNLSLLLEQLRQFKNEIRIPLVLMGYLNPVLQYGFEKFCADAAAAGVDGLILPDLPASAFENEYKKYVVTQGLDFIFLVTPETDEERVKKLDGLSTGFLYAVSASATTGSQTGGIGLQHYLSRLNALHLKNPVLVGFGIHDKAGFDTVCQSAAGGIIGSAYIKALKNSKDVKATTKSFLSSILEG